jgi:phosphate transport system permease protein
MPGSLREAALAMGATRAEAIGVMLDGARPGMLGAAILGLGRALGETMAVTMVIGNTNRISASLLAPGATMASVIANEFTEATGRLYLSALTEIALVLFAPHVVVNALARSWCTARPVPEGHRRCRPEAFAPLVARGLARGAAS